MSDTVLSVVADSSSLPIAVIGDDGRLLIANKALRRLVDDQVIEGGKHGHGLSSGRRVILPTRTGGALALNVIEAPDGSGGWILRGEEPDRRSGMSEEAPFYLAEPDEGRTLLDMHLLHAAKRAVEQERSVGLLLLRPLGIDDPACDDDRAAIADALAQFDRRLVANLRAADQLLVLDDGVRAVVAVVSDASGAATLAARIAALFAGPPLAHGTGLALAVQVGIGHADATDVLALDGLARADLARSRRTPPFLPPPPCGPLARGITVKHE